MNTQSTISQAKAEATPYSAEFWADTWRQVNKQSFLKCSQCDTPGSWDTFYDEIADIYLDMWGDAFAQGNAVTARLLQEKVLWPGARVLDVGCGPGSVAIPMALQGARVTALDQSTGMLGMLRGQMDELGLDNIDIAQQSWESYFTDEPYDLVLASCFPDAMSPEGLELLESWSRGPVALVMGAGHKAFAFRRAMWEMVLDVPFHNGNFHQVCALNYLLATKRLPNLRHLSWMGEFDHPLEGVLRFYRAYFAIFGKKGPEVEDRLRRALDEHLVDGRVKSSGDIHLALLWWDKNPGTPAP